MAEAHWLRKPPQQLALVYQDDRPPLGMLSRMREVFSLTLPLPAVPWHSFQAWRGRISQAMPPCTEGESSNPPPSLSSSGPPFVNLPGCLRTVSWEGSEKSCHEVRDQLVSQPSQSAGQTGGGLGEQMVPSVSSPQPGHPVGRHAEWLRGLGRPSAGLSDR